MRTKRVPTGIKGFDELVEGGFPEGASILICGTPGTGKTIFGMEFVYYGAKKFNEKCLYVSFEQKIDDIREQAARFGWDFQSLEKSGKLKIMHIPLKNIDENTTRDVVKVIQKNGIKRVIIDSISTLAVNAPIYTTIKDMTMVDMINRKKVFSPAILGDFVVKRFIYGFISELNNMEHCTSLLISESSEKGEYLSRDTISEFFCDGVVHLTFESMGGQYSRSLIVRKMRKTANDEDIHPLEISNKGVVIHDIK